MKALDPRCGLVSLRCIIAPALGSLRARPLRTVLMTFGVVLGVAVILGISTTNVSTLAASTVFFALVVVLTVWLRGRPLPIAVPLALVLFFAGYIFMARAFLAREDPRPVPQLVRTKDDPGLGHTAVVYFTHGESEPYDPIGWINQLNEFDEQGIAFVPLVARPLFAYQLRNHYLEVGRSDHRRMHIQMINRLEEAFRAEGDTTTQFYLSFLDDDPRPDAAVIQALNDGASRIVVSRRS